MWVFCVFLTAVSAGPGAILYPLAALIWAALTYRLFTLSLINAVVILSDLLQLKSRFILHDSSISLFIDSNFGTYWFSHADSLAVDSCVLLAEIGMNYIKKFYTLQIMIALTHAMNRRYFLRTRWALLKKIELQLTFFHYHDWYWSF